MFSQKFSFQGSFFHKRLVFFAANPEGAAASEAQEARQKGVETELKGDQPTAEAMKNAADKHIDSKKLDSGDTAKDKQLKDDAKKAHYCK